MTCSWLSNSWVCARRVSVAFLVAPSCRCTAISSDRSRSVVTVPEATPDRPPVRAVRRFTTSTRSRCTTTTIDAGAPAEDDIQQIRFQPQIGDIAADAVRRQIEQRPGTVVDDGDLAARPHPEDALPDAVQQGLPVIGQAGDLGGLQPVGLLLDPAGQQPGAGDAGSGGEHDQQQQLRHPGPQNAPGVRVLLADQGQSDQLTLRRNRPGHWPRSAVARPASGHRPRTAPSRPTRPASVNAAPTRVGIGGGDDLPVDIGQQHHGGARLDARGLGDRRQRGGRVEVPPRP